jgi:hypothetical protein
MIFPCPPCQSNYDGWLNYGPPITGWIQYMNPTRSAEAYKAKQHERSALVKRQLDGITNSCRNRGCI